MTAGAVADGVGAHLIDNTGTPVDALSTITANPSGNTVTLGNGAALSPPTAFTNSGTIILTGNSSITVAGFQPYQQSTGTTNLSSAGSTLEAGDVNISGGTLSGIGSVLGV